MLKRAKFRVVGTSVVVALLTVVIAAPAFAPGTRVPSDVIVFTLTADINGLNGVPEPPPPPQTAYVPWIDSSGTYLTALSTLCTGVSVPDPMVDPMEGALRMCSIPSHGGSFINIVCGTGTAGSFAAPMIAETGPPHAAEAITVTKYSILFVAGIGVLVGVVTEPPDASGLAFGVVRIGATPTPTPPAPKAVKFGPCAFGFDVVGAAVTFQAAP